MQQDRTWSTREPALDIAQTREQRRAYFACKRLFDVVVSAVLLLLLWPLMLLIAILVILDTGGPAFFQQQRVGLCGRKGRHKPIWELNTFTMYKFRTMLKDADSDVHRAFVRALIRNDEAEMAALQGQDTQARKLVNDPRVTRLGKFLRKSSLDELPQLYNVLRGDMSLVGPRPAIPYEVEMYEPWHWRRLEATPGLTGLWQVTARSSVDFDEMVELDLYYIGHQSFWLDLKILLKTPLTVLCSKGAV
jgi:lipopolysaccharide/colanic/teichoic acid biosynthesis glycosyltransferase